MSISRVIISDTQIPFHDKAATKAVLRFIGEFQPDEVVHIGDLMDYPQPARWSKGTREEFETNIEDHSLYARTHFLKPLRELHGGPVKVHEGNHDLRPRAYLAKYAPALDRSKAFHMETLLHFNDFGIERADDFNELAPGWITTHGHVGNISLSQIAGRTATNAAVKFAKSVIIGHTHRLGMGNHTVGYAQAVSNTYSGVEVGNLMDMKQAHYLKGGTANWQQGFAVTRTSEKHTQVDLIQIRNKRFMVDGHTYTI